MQKQKKNSSQIFENLVFINNNSVTFNINKPNNFSQKRTRTTFINDFADSMSKKEQEDLEFALAQALFATGVSFSFLENPYVIEFFQKIRPAFKLPSQLKLANELLDKVYKKSIKKSKIALDAILELIVVTLKQFESDNSTLSSIYFYFKKMVEEILAYMLDSWFLETNNPSEEAMGYSEFTTFTKEKFDQDEFVNLFIELVKFRKKISLYNNEVIWNSATSFTPSLWWQLWPYSNLQQMAIKILSIPTSSVATERNFSIFGFIHNKVP
ncbi:783_t:CDS:2 [Gigaspora rosea]|nr:783_t:CDS:2 [Gigaspora rosea]